MGARLLSVAFDLLSPALVTSTSYPAPLLHGSYQRFLSLVLIVIVVGLRGLLLAGICWTLFTHRRGFPMAGLGGAGTLFEGLGRGGIHDGGAQYGRASEPQLCLC